VNGIDNAGAGYAMSAGSLLRDAREAAGLSMDTVAQQLKLAPRQVRAIEEDDYARLPGRTFVRGFVRNYARLLNLDPDAVVATLPHGESTSPLERLTFSPASSPMGEIPVESERKRSSTRWLIPLALLAIVAAAAYYEHQRPTTGDRRAATDASPAPAPLFPPAGQTTTSLPNPLETTRSEAPAAAAPDSAPVVSSPAPAAPAASPSLGVPAATTPSAAAVSPTPSTLVLTWSGPSWVEIKDAGGTALLSQRGTAGNTQTVSGAAPFDIVIGNASNVSLTFRGQPYDLAPHTRYNVARFSLK
jgi:cytoskeleton protein RodZ